MPIERRHRWVHERFGSADPLWLDAKGDDVHDDTAAFTEALTAVGEGGTVKLLPGKTYILSDLEFTNHRQLIIAEGIGAVLKAKAGATWIVKADSKLGCRIENVTIDGNSKASSGVLFTATNSVSYSQHNSCARIRFVNCLIGAKITGTTGTPPSDQIDTSTFERCVWEDCTTGLWIKSTNAQITRVTSAIFASCDVGVQASHSTIFLESVSFQFNHDDEIGILCDGTSLDWVSLRDTWFEAAPAATGCVAIESVSVGAGIEGWPIQGVIAEHCTFVRCDINMGLISGAGTVPVLVARGCQFVSADINTDVDEAVFRDEYNTFDGSSAWTPTGAAATSSHWHRWTYQGYWHYLGTSLRSHINTNGDYVAGHTNVGLVLLSPDGHYWRIKIDNAGALTYTDTGTTLPENA